MSTATVADAAAAVCVATSDLEDHVIRVYDDGDGVRGFFSLEPFRGECSLDLMFVANGWTGRGIGRLLFTDLVATARRLQYRGILIVSHPPASGFYEHMGARRIGIEPAGGNASWERPRLWYDVAVKTDGGQRGVP